VASRQTVDVSASVIFPCTIKSRRFLLAPANPGSPRKRVVKWLCVPDPQHSNRSDTLPQHIYRIILISADQTTVTTQSNVTNPHRDHGREVERGDTSGDPQWQPIAVNVHIPGYVRQRLAENSTRNATTMLHDLCTHDIDSITTGNSHVHSHHVNI